MRQTDQAIELRPWLFRITHNQALNLLRQNGWTHEPLEHRDRRRRAARPGVRAPREPPLRAGRRVGLPERQRDALILRELEGRSYEEIARELKVSGGAVRQLLSRARDHAPGGRELAHALGPGAACAGGRDRRGRHPEGLRRRGRGGHRDRGRRLDRARAPHRPPAPRAAKVFVEPKIVHARRPGARPKPRAQARRPKQGRPAPAAAADRGGRVPRGPPPAPAPARPKKAVRKEEPEKEVPVFEEPKPKPVTKKLQGAGVRGGGVQGAGPRPGGQGARPPARREAAAGRSCHRVNSTA